MNANWFKNLFVAGLAFVSTADAVQAAMPKAGDTAPLFTGQDQDGKIVKLADLIGKKIVLLYFYPKDFTSGCTKEACGFRDRMSELQKDNVEIVGVSFDSIESHQKFIAQYKLNFRLLADPYGKIVDAYGVKWGGRKSGPPRQLSYRARRQNCPHHRRGQSRCPFQRDEGGHRRFKKELNCEIPARQNRRWLVNFGRGVVV